MSLDLSEIDGKGGWSAALGFSWMQILQILQIFQFQEKCLQ